MAGDVDLFGGGVGGKMVDFFELDEESGFAFGFKFFVCGVGRESILFPAMRGVLLPTFLIFGHIIFAKILFECAGDNVATIIIKNHSLVESGALFTGIETHPSGGDCHFAVQSPILRVC